MANDMVDTRVVKMEFDNQQFERNIKQTSKSLDNFKQSLDFRGVGDSVDEVSVKISSLQIAMTTFIANISNRLINLGIQFTKSLSVDNISAGWAKFGEKTTSVATMMAQKIRIAGQEITDLAEKTSIVNDQLELLTWFSDETSYSFTDMVNNVGKFTAAGQDLDKSVKAMEGIATWAALSGQNAQTASRAMYQLAQAMGKGKIQKIDWMSIQNANMDTEEFRETILATAVAMGELTREGDKFVTKTGKKFTQAQFSDYLSEGWFTSDVLVKGLNKYSAAIDEIYEIASREGITASEVIEKYGDQLDEFGVKAFRAAQEARTFADVLSSVKDAVSSKWMTTFESIFGGQKEAVQLWTDLANELYDVFAESGNFRNDILAVWKELGGRDDLFAKDGDNQGAFWNLYDAIVSVIDLIKSSWNVVFPLTEMEEYSDQAEDIGRKIKTLTQKLRDFTAIIKQSEAFTLRLSRILKTIFTFVKMGINALKIVRYILDPLVDLGKELINKVLDKIAYAGNKVNSIAYKLEAIVIKLHDAVQGLVDDIDLPNFLEDVFGFIGDIFKVIADAKPITKIIDLVKNFVKIFKENIKSGGILKTIIDAIKSTFSLLFKVLTGAMKLVSSLLPMIFSIFNSFASLAGNLSGTFINLLLSAIKFIGTLFDYIKESGFIENFVNAITNSLSSLSGIITPLFNFILKIAKVLINVITKLANTIFSIFDNLTKKVGSVGILKTLGNIFTELFNILGGLFTSKEVFKGEGGSVFTAIKDLLNSIMTIVKDMIPIVTTLLQIIGPLVKKISQVILAFVDMLRKSAANKEGANIIKFAIKVALVIAALAILSKVMIGALKIVKELKWICEYIEQLLWSVKQYMMSKVYKNLAMAFLYMATALMLIASVDDKQMVNALATAIILAYTMLSVLAILNKMAKTMEKGTIKKVRSITSMFNTIALSLVIAAAAMTTIAKIDVQMQDRVLKTMLILLGTFVLIIDYFQNELKASKVERAKAGTKMIRSLVNSLFVMALALRLLANQPWEGIAAATGGLLICLIGLTEVTLILSKKTGAKAKKALEAAFLIGKLSAAMLTMAISLRLLTSQPWLGIAAATGAMIVCLYAFMEATLILSKKTGTNMEKAKVAVKLVKKLASSMFTVALALRLLTSQPWLGIATATGAMTLCLYAFMEAVLILSKKTGTNMEKARVATKLITKIASSMFIVALSLRILTGQPWDGILAATLSMLACLYGFVSASLTLSKKIGTQFKKIVASMFMLKILASTMFTVALSLRLLTGQSWQGIAAATGAMMVALYGFVGAILILSKKTGTAKKKTAAALKLLLGIAASMVAFGIALRMVAGIPWQQMLISVGIMAATLLVVVGMVAILNKISGSMDISITFFKLAAAMLVLAISMQALAGGFRAFNNVDFSSIFKGLIAFAGALLILGVVSKIVEGTAIGVIFKVAAALALIGVGLLAAGIGLRYFGDGLGNLVSGLAPLLELLTITLVNLVIQIVEGLLEALPQIIEALGPILDAVTNLCPKIFALVMALIEGILTILDEEGPHIIETVVALIDALLVSLNDHMGSIADSIFGILKTILNRIATNIEDLGQSLIDIVIGLLKTLTRNIGPLTQALIDFLIEATIALFERIGPLIDIVTDYVFDFIARVTVAVTGKVIALAGLITKVVLIVIAAVLRLTIASLGALSKLFITFVGALILILVHTFMAMSNVIFAALKTVFVELLRLTYKVISWAIPALRAIGKVIFAAIGKGLLNALVNAFSWLIDMIPGLRDKIDAGMNKINQAIDADVNQTLSNLGGGVSEVQALIEEAGNNINNVVAMTGQMANDAIVDGMGQISDTVTDSMELLGDALTQFGEEAGSNLYQGMGNSDNINGANQVGQEMGNATAEGFSEATDTHSPSRLFERFGHFLMEGLNLGIQNNASETENAIAEVINNSLQLATDILDGQNGDDYTIKVGMDISSVEAQTSRIQDIMSGVNNPSITASGRNAGYNASALDRNNSKGSDAVNNDNSTTVTYNNTFNIESTDPQQSADEIDRVLKEQNTRFKLAHGT